LICDPKHLGKGGGCGGGRERQYVHVKIKIKLVVKCQKAKNLEITGQTTEVVIFLPNSWFPLVKNQYVAV
jgi:hypothetical protein